MTTFLTRESARVVRATINAKAKEAGSNAMLRAPVKGDNGLWIFPGLSHGKTLSLKKG